MKIGDKVYVFDQNHRVYRHDADGQSLSGPIYREHFVLREIVGENSKSWIVGYPGWKFTDRGCTKHAKKACQELKTLEQVDEAVYIQENAYKISEAVRRADYAILKAVAQLISYQEVK